MLLMQRCISESLDQIYFREISESKLSLTADHVQQQVPKGFPNSRIAFHQRVVQVTNERKGGMLVSFWSPTDFEIPSFSG